MRSFLNWCRKYLSLSTILILAAIGYILFIQDYSVSNIYQNRRTIDSLEQVYKEWNDTLSIYRDRNERFDNREPEIIEHVAREQFNMSLPTEEVYVFE